MGLEAWGQVAVLTCSWPGAWGRLSSRPDSNSLKISVYCCLLAFPKPNQSLPQESVSEVPNGSCNFRLHQYRYLLLTIKDLQKIECTNSVRDRNRLSFVIWLRALLSVWGACWFVIETVSSYIINASDHMATNKHTNIPYPDFWPHTRTWFASRVAGFHVIYTVLLRTHKSAPAQHQTRLVYGPFQPPDLGYWTVDLSAALLHAYLEWIERIYGLR